MRINFFSWLFAAILLVSCSGSNSKNETVTDETSTESKESTDNSSSKKDASTSADEAQKRIDELKKVQPITNDQLKSFFAEEVMGMKRSQFSVNSAAGYATGTAVYKKDDTTQYSVMVYDCAGEAGSAFYGMRYLMGWNMEREDDNGYEKTVSFKGSKALESYNKNSRRHTLNFVTADRFWITLEGDKTGLDNLKSFADNLNLDKLKDLK